MPDSPQDPAVLVEALAEVNRAGARFLPLPPGKNWPPPTGWTADGFNRWIDPDAAAKRIAAGGNCAIAIPPGSRLVIVDADDAEAVDRCYDRLGLRRNPTLTWATPRGRQWLLETDGRPLSPKNHGLGPAVELRPPGHYGLAPGSRRTEDSYPPEKLAAAREKGLLPGPGPWFYRAAEAAPVIRPADLAPLEAVAEAPPPEDETPPPPEDEAPISPAALALAFADAVNDGNDEAAETALDRLIRAANTAEADRRRETDRARAEETVLEAAPRIRSGALDDDAVLETVADSLRPPFVYTGALADADGDYPKTMIAWAGKDGALLVDGEILVVSGAGAAGKSTLTLQWALAAAGAAGFPDDPNAPERDDDPAARFVEALPPGPGISIRRAPVVIGCYEDLAAVVRDRARRILAGHESSAAPRPAKEIPRDLSLVGLRGSPLYGPISDAAPGTAPGRAALYNARPGLLPAWRPFWTAVSRLLGPKGKRGPGLVILDPAMAAFVAEDIRTAPVREFLDACREELDRLDAGLVVVAHPSKKGRADGGADPASGSAAWFDAARGCLYLGRSAAQDAEYDPAFDLDGKKANHGPAFDGRTLRRDGRAAFRTETDQERTARIAAAKAAKAAKDAGGSGYRSTADAEAAGWTKTPDGWTRDPVDPDARRYPRLKDIPR